MTAEGDSAGRATNNLGKGSDAVNTGEQGCNKWLGVNGKAFCGIAQGVSPFLLHLQGF